MQFKDFNEVRNYHHKKRCEILNELCINMDPIFAINTSLLEDQTNSRKAIKADREIEYSGHRYKFFDVADSIRNPSRLRVLYLLPHSENTKDMCMLIEQAHKLASRGHDVLIYSHTPRPTWTKCNVPYTIAHPDCNLGDITPRADVVVAGSWDLAVDAQKVKAPLKYICVSDESDISGYYDMDDFSKNAMHTAFKLPLKILAVSKDIQPKITRLFGRSSDLIPYSDTDDVNVAVDILEDKFIAAARSTIQAVQIK